MPLLFTIPILTKEIVHALNWTLLHSLWQGMLLSLSAGIIVFYTREAKPSLRYNLLTAALLIFVIAITATFFIQINDTGQFAALAQSGDYVNTNINQPVVATAGTESTVSVTAQIVDFFNAHANALVFIWLFIVGLQFIRLTAGLYGVYQLKRKHVISAGEYWNDRIVELSRRLHIKSRVRLLQSGVARMPAVIGYFKPVILFPAAMLASLPVEEVEAILVHELAHIRRKDFLVNLVQQLVEIIFFFNPAVLWVSSLIKSEREHCCDDIAVSQTDSKDNYIRALMSFQGFSLQPGLALTTAFAGEKNHLINRVKRIIYNNNKTLNNMEKKFLAVGMVVTSVFIFAFSVNKVPGNGRYKHIISQHVAVPLTGTSLGGLALNNDTVPVGKPEQPDKFSGKITTTVKGKRYTIVYDDSQVTELHVNGKKIPSENIANYEEVTNELMDKAKEDAEQSKQDMEESALELEQSKIELEESNKEMEQSKFEMEQDKKEMELEKEQEKKDMELSKIELEQSKIEMERSEKEAREDMKRARFELEQSKKQIILSKKEMEQSRHEMEESKKDMERSKKLQESIVEDFIKEKIINDKKDLSSYKLSDQELIVNGVRQPEAIYQKFKAKYVKSSHWTMSYNNQ